jgi:hypothetical protein
MVRRRSKSEIVALLSEYVVYGSYTNATVYVAPALT